MARLITTSVLCLVLCTAWTLQPTSAQLLAGQAVNVRTYNNELYYESAGSYQRILYEDAVNSTATTNLIWSEVHVAPCGQFVGCRIANANDRGGCQTVTAGHIVPVAANTLHSAENPSCTPVRAFQAFAGRSSFQQLDMLSAILQLSPSSVEYGLSISAAQVRNSAQNIMPIFTVNQACLAKCNSTAPAPAAS